MRHLLLALLIALLPLRGWVGEVMATEMATSGVAQLQIATKTVADHLHPAGGNPHFYHASPQEQVAQAVPDCAGHGAAQNAAGADAHCDTCTACQACHTLALSPLATSPGAVVFAPAVPRSSAAHFASALAALGQKPPIS